MVLARHSEKTLLFFGALRIEYVPCDEVCCMGYCDVCLGYVGLCLPGALCPTLSYHIICSIHVLWACSLVVFHSKSMVHLVSQSDSTSRVRATQMRVFALCLCPRCGTQPSVPCNRQRYKENSDTLSV